MKKIGIVLSVVLAVLFGFLLWRDKKTEDMQAAQINALYSQASSLEKEREAIQRQLDQLPEKYQEKQSGKATEQLLFTELDGQLYHEVYPLMQEFQVNGVMALSLQEMPGMDNKITREQFDELIDAGWTYCLLWDGQQELSSWLDTIQALLIEEELSMPQVLYFNTGTYFSQADDIIFQYGITTAVHPGEEDLPLIALENDSNVWQLGCYPWNGYNVVPSISDMINSSGNLSFCVSFNGTDDAYHQTSFRNMLAYVTACRDEELLLITDFEKARFIQEENMAERRELESEFQTQEEKLQAQLDSVNSQLRELYDSGWFMQQ